MSISSILSSVFGTGSSSSTAAADPTQQTGAIGTPTAADPSGAAAPTGSGSDGSVGLLDGVLKDALVGGAAGAGVGLIPFLPGGPILGGIIGALAGAGYKLYKNYKKIKQIQQYNVSFVQQLGVQAQNTQQAQQMIEGNDQVVGEAYAGNLISQAAQQGAVQQGAATGADPTTAGAGGTVAGAGTSGAAAGADPNAALINSFMSSSAVQGSAGQAAASSLATDPTTAGGNDVPDTTQQLTAHDQEVQLQERQRVVAHLKVLQQALAKATTSTQKRKLQGEINKSETHLRGLNKLIAATSQSLGALATGAGVPTVSALPASSLSGLPDLTTNPDAVSAAVSGVGAAGVGATGAAGVGATGAAGVGANGAALPNDGVAAATVTSSTPSIQSVPSTVLASNPSPASAVAVPAAPTGAVTSSSAPPSTLPTGASSANNLALVS